jgi:hypothetical protein
VFKGLEALMSLSRFQRENVLMWKHDRSLETADPSQVGTMPSLALYTSGFLNDICKQIVYYTYDSARFFVGDLVNISQDRSLETADPNRVHFVFPGSLVFKDSLSEVRPLS